jgi:PEGA domain/Double zinc ribbon
MKRCAPCRLEYPDANDFCKLCGLQLSEAVTDGPCCPSCGAATHHNWKFCKQCGHAADEITVVRARTASVSGTRSSARRMVIAASVALLVILLATGGTAAAWYAAGIKVTIQTDPGNSTIVIDGQEIGRTNDYGTLVTSRIRTGDHSLTVLRDGYDEWKQPFTIAFTDMSKNLNVKLNPTKFKLTILSTPASSEVFVDNNSVGTTNEANGTLETSPLSPGEYTVVVRKDGYRDWKQRVEIKAHTKLEIILNSAPAYDSNTSADIEIRNTLEGWAQSSRNRDLDLHMRYYADTLDYYYSRTLVPSAKIREDRLRAYTQFNYLSVQLNNLAIQLDSTGQRATVVMDKTFDFRGDNNAFYNGSVQNQMTLTKLGGAWLITGEKELKVYYVNK